MAKNKGKIENLKPIKPLSHDEAVEQGRRGGKKSVEVRRERKLLSQIYGDLLADEYEIKIDGKMQKIEGASLVKAIAKDVLERRDSSSVSMMKEIREATEGKNINLSAGITILASSTDENL